ncbi:unnamed protein product [Callosobruchus maculatus]|uniref:Uncharacterized protein n=1 Tax=Callosobruchus maculatus TaxID=64391 RepID=A0A653BFV0_CALMS|nr:unnamed protein product [Callosobruchus maculatus]
MSVRNVLKTSAGTYFLSLPESVWRRMVPHPRSICKSAEKKLKAFLPWKKSPFC